MRLRSCGFTDAGRVAQVNEDAVLTDDEHGLYIVSDGVGRYRGAAVASRSVVETVGELLRQPPQGEDARRRWLLEAVKKAAATLVQKGKQKPELASMAATLTLLRFVGPDRFLLHVGDSRAYLWRGGRLEQLTRDHSLAFEQYEAGAITKEALRTHPNQKLLTRTIRASSSLVLPELAVGTVSPGDRYLLCTDGLTKELTDEQIAARLASSDDLAAVCRGLVDAANEAGGGDNVTVVVVAVA